MVLHVGQDGGHGGKKQLHTACQQIQRGRAAAFVGHMGHVQLGLLPEQLARQVVDAAITGGTKVNPLRACRYSRAQLRQGFDTHLFVGHHQQRAAPNEGHGREVFVHLVGGCALGHRVGDEGGGGEQQGVAIRLRLGHHIGPDGATAAALVVHHHRLAQFVDQRFGDVARNAVRAATGCEGHDQGDGA